MGNFINVLILIVVDNGLVHEDVAFAGNHLIKHVLILIVVDNGLVLLIILVLI